jgi:LmbE family N-acetylglucosaminyl deacetylase
MRAEFIHDRPSQAALTGMSLDMLTALNGRLQERGADNKGNKYVRQQQKKVGKELERRGKLDARSGSSLSADSHANVPILHHIFDSEQPKVGLTGVLVEAHHDDIAQFRLTKHLASQGVTLKVITLTKSDQRGLKNYTPEQLDLKRWHEGVAQNSLAGAKEMHRIGLPDGLLDNHIHTAAEFLSEMSEGANFFVAPHLLDPHPDHRAAHETALEAAGSEIPVYGMDTITGFDMYGDLLVPDRYAVLSMGEARREKKMYKANNSQVEDLPLHERRDMFNVLGMTRRRGEQFRVPHAAVIFDPLNTNNDPLGEIVAFKAASL